MTNNKIIEENTSQKEKKCNHFMVWNLQGGYAYYRCGKCNYIDGKKTFRGALSGQKEEIKKVVMDGEIKALTDILKAIENL